MLNGLSTCTSARAALCKTRQVYQLSLPRSRMVAYATTNERVFSPHVVQAVLSLMFSCGMDDVSGEFAFTMGFPAQTGGASGA